MTNDKILVVCGPTATGKTALALKLAQRFNGELINADSRQVYRGMDIVTGKDLPGNSKFEYRNSKLGVIRNELYVGYREKDGVQIWLVDIVDPDYIFNVGEYQKLAHIVIQDILKRGKLPIVVGGTGLYIKSIIEPVPFAQIPPDQSLRETLYQLTLIQLQKRLRHTDLTRWEAMNRSDRVNPRRLVRAIEIADFTQSLSKSFSFKINKKTYDSLIIGLTTLREFLFKRINIRVDQRVKEGAIEELSGLLKNGYSLQLPSMTATGYKDLALYLNGHIPVPEAIKHWKLSEHSYAKRQMTWFKKYSYVQWFSITEANYQDKIVQKVAKWYTAS